MAKIWQSALLASLVCAVSAGVEAQTTLPKDNEYTQPNTAAPKSTPRPVAHSGKESTSPLTSTEQDHVTASRPSSDAHSKANGMNRAVAAPAHSAPAHPARHPHASPAPRAKKSSGTPHHRTPTEAHSAVKDNPNLPLKMPPAQGAPSAPPPNRTPEQPQ